MLTRVEPSHHRTTYTAKRTIQRECLRKEKHVKLYLWVVFIEIIAVAGILATVNHLLKVNGL